MLLRHEAYKERALHGTQLRAEKTRTYGHLKIDPLVGKDGEVYYQGSRDLLVSVFVSTAELADVGEMFAEGCAH